MGLNFLYSLPTCFQRNASVGINYYSCGASSNRGSLLPHETPYSSIISVSRHVRFDCMVHVEVIFNAYFDSDLVEE